jgi:alpha-tubulin suppressor-like RCC1 family protein
LLANAVDAISASVPSDLILDGDGDGNVDSVCFVVRGEPTAWSTLLWPHKTSLSSQTVYINSERVYSYNLQLQSVFTVGVLCHEMFHLLGAPDLYHYYYDLSPVGPWDLMEWNLDPPQHMAAYMKYRYGNWIGSIPEITVPGTYILNPLTSAVDNCYKIRSRTPSQYFVVEYRREASSVFEDSLPGTGLLVYRIDTARDGYGNPWGPPDEVYVYRPGGTPTTDGDLSSACFSSSAGRVAISDTTDPAGFLADGAPGGLDISDVSAASGTISFNVRRLPGTASGVYSSGYNSFGQLGVGDSINRIYPTQVPTPSAVTAIAGGAQHSLILMGNGDVYAAGNGEHGQLGNGSTSRRFTPIRIESLSGVKSIACGDWHSLVLTESGDVYAFGYNRYGQLGLVDSQNRTSPTKIPTLAGAKAIAAGQYHSLVLLENGDVYSFGSSSYGQLGLGDTENHGAPTKIPNLSAAKAIAAGGDHSLVLLENGDVYSFGYNGNGELGLGDRGVSAYRVVPEKIPDFSGVKIAAGCRHSLALSENGEVYAFGDNGSGQLGLGDTEERNSPTRIPTLSGAKAIAGGGYYSFVLMESRETYAFGYNLTGELGLGDRSNRMYPTQIPALSGATLIACGGNHSIVALVCSSPPPPSAPSATDGMYSDKVHVGWTEVPDAARYEVWRAVSADGVYTNVGELESHAFDDTTVTDGQTYWYRVRACNDCGRSDFSPADSGYAGVLQNTPAAFRVTGQGSVQADGVFYSSGFNTGAADVAEWVSVSEPVEAGTVLELDTSQPGWYRRSHTPCSTLVAGVVSSQPGMVLGGPDGPIEGMALLALTGIVPVKVTDEGGPIQPGDLLVSSSTPGYAMRWAGPDPCPCALVGKALEPMTDERGVISVLLTAH